MVSFPYYSHKNPWRGPWNQPWLFATIASWGRGKVDPIASPSFLFGPSSGRHLGFTRDFSISGNMVRRCLILFEVTHRFLLKPYCLMLVQPGWKILKFWNVSKQSCMTYFLWFSVSMLLCQSLYKSSTWWHMSSGSHSCLNKPHESNCFAFQQSLRWSLVVLSDYSTPLKRGWKESCSVLFRVVCSISPQIKDIAHKPWRMLKGSREY